MSKKALSNSARDVLLAEGLAILGNGVGLDPAERVRFNTIIAELNGSNEAVTEAAETLNEVK